MLFLSAGLVSDRTTFAFQNVLSFEKLESVLRLVGVGRIEIVLCLCAFKVNQLPLLGSRCQHAFVNRRSTDLIVLEQKVFSL